MYIVHRIAVSRIAISFIVACQIGGAALADETTAPPESESPAQTSQVVVPLRLDYPLLQQLLVTQLFTGPGQSRELVNDPSGCNEIVLSEPVLAFPAGLEAGSACRFSRPRRRGRSRHLCNHIYLAGTHRRDRQAGNPRVRALRWGLRRTGSDCWIQRGSRWPTSGCSRWPMRERTQTFLQPFFCRSRAAVAVGGRTVAGCVAAPFPPADSGSARHTSCWRSAREQ